MTASSSFRGSCDYCNKPGQKKAQSFKFLRESSEKQLPSSGAGRSSWCSLHNTHLHDNADCRAQKQQRGNGGVSGYNRGNNNNGNSNRQRHDGGSNTGRANTVVTVNRTSSATIIAPVSANPVAAPSDPVAACLLHLLPRLFQLISRLLQLLSGLLLCRTSSNRLHRASATRFSQAPLLRTR